MPSHQPPVLTAPINSSPLFDTPQGWGPGFAKATGHGPGVVVVRGGFVIIDDWVFGGCQKAVLEYFAEQDIDPYLWTLDRTTRCFQRC